MKRLIQASTATENLVARADDIREAQTLWAAFNCALHHLGPPPEVVEGWDRISPWLSCQAMDARQQEETFL